MAGLALTVKETGRAEIDTNAEICGGDLSVTDEDRILLADAGVLDVRVPSIEIR